MQETLNRKSRIGKDLEEVTRPGIENEREKIICHRSKQQISEMLIMNSIKERNL